MIRKPLKCMLRVGHFQSNNNAQKIYSFKQNVTYIEPHPQMTNYLALDSLCMDIFHNFVKCNFIVFSKYARNKSVESFVP